MKLKIYVSPVELIPKGYGIGYRKWNSDIIVCYPIPINLIIGLFRLIWYRIKAGIYPNIHMEMYDRGLAAGRAEVVNTKWLTYISQELEPYMRKVFREESKEYITRYLNTADEIMTRMEKLKEINNEN